MRHFSRAMWALSVGLMMILSSSVMIGEDRQEGASSALPAEQLTAQPQPEPLADFNPWVNYTGSTVYHSWTEMVACMQKIAADHPDITKLISIGKSWQGRDIWAMKVSDNPYVEEPGEPEVLFNGNHHAREWMTIQINLYALEYLTDQYGTNATATNIVDNRQVWFVPSVNPDGRVYDSAGDDPAVHARQSYGWRKNTRDNDNSGTFTEAADGVDLNRNYGYLWGASGASSDYTQDIYGGPYPFSEPETAAMKNFARQHKFVFDISFHTSSQLILYPWGWSYEDAPDKGVFVSVGKKMQAAITNRALSDTTPYTLEKSSELYPTAGSDDDWLYGELGVFAYCIEAYPSSADVSSGDAAVTGSYDQFHPAATKVLPVCIDNLGAILLLCNAAANPYQYMDHVSMSPKEATARIVAGNSGGMTINVTDDGQRADSFTISRTIPAGWTVNVAPTAMSLARNQTSPATLSITVPGAATPGLYKIWVNATSTSNASCKASSLITVDVPYPADVTPVSLDPFTELGDFPKGQYRIDSTVSNIGTAATGTFNTQLTIKQLGVGSTVTLFTDNIESAITNQWTIVDHDVTYSASVWQRSTAQKHAGTYSAWCGSGSAYTDSTVQSLMMTNPISLERYNSATLQFWSYYSTENYYDFLMVEASMDNGKSWDYVTRYTGTGTTWTLRTLDLSDFLGAQQFKLRFRFTSDEATTGTGAFIDDITITANDPTESIVYGPAALPVGALAVGGSQDLSWNYNFNTAGTFQAEVQTLYGSDGNAANNLRTVMFYINGTRTLPEFAGVRTVTNPGQGAAVKVEWDQGLQINDPLTYKVYRFTYAPTSAQVNASTPIWIGTALECTDSTVTAGTTYYYVVRAADALGQAEYNYVSRSIRPGFSVQHWGPTGGSGTWTMYMRYDNALGTTQTTTSTSYLSGSGGTVYTGFRAWKKNSSGVETEITGGTATSIVSRSTTTSGIQTSTYACPQTAMATTDSLVVRIYQSLATPPTGLAATFTSAQLGITSIDAATWTMNYYTQRGTNNDRFWWGTTTYNSRIDGFKWTFTSDPAQHNTLNWTVGGTIVSQYKVYRSDSQLGPWDAAHLVATTNSSTFTYLDMDKGTADSTYWWYVIRAVDGYGVEESNTNAVQEPGAPTGTPYAISLAGKTANSWVFVSFPSGLTGNVQDILNDATRGDGLTTWTIAKWYNPLTPSDPWKTYRAGGTANDMPAVSNQMGFWLWITANGGDQALTLSSYAAVPASTVINLNFGWNLVGYPSTTDRLASSCLPIGADAVSYWTSVQPYITDSTPASVTFHHGNGYYIRVSATCVWTVTEP